MRWLCLGKLVLYELVVFGLLVQYEVVVFG